MVNNDVEFNLTPELVTLLRNSYVSRDLSDVEYGAAEIDGKRPYGNSDVAYDIAELLDWEFDADDEMPEEFHQKAYDLHKQTPRALQIVLKTGSFEPGVYRRSAYYFNDWERVS